MPCLRSMHRKPDFCLIGKDGITVVCMREPSDRPIDCKIGIGYLHRLTDPLPARRLPPPVADRPVTIDAPALAATYRLDLAKEDLPGLAASLGVSEASLRRFGVGWSGGHDAWSFPMYSIEDEIVGIRLRASTPDADGKIAKFCQKGSHGGMFIPDGYVPDLLEQIVVCEGPTDAAAGLDLGVWAMGRQSCSSDVDATVAICRGRDAVVVGDCDEPHERKDGTVWYPGLEGAEALCKALVGRARSVKLLLPLKGKDLRAWLQNGCTPDLLRAVIRNTAPWKRYG